MYEHPENMFEEAAKQGIIVIKNVSLNVNDIIVKVNQCVEVKNNEQWKNFLLNVIENSDNQSEIIFAQMFLNITQQIIQHEKPAITDNDVSTLTKKIEACQTIDDILQIIDNKKLEIRAKDSLPISDTITWKRPIVVNNRCRYYSHNTDWYIERHDGLTAGGGQSYFYSIHNPENKEVARYDKIKHAKDDIINIIKALTR